MLHVFNFKSPGALSNALPKGSSSQGGVSLIEVLISMFVLAVGILGVVSLQAVSIKDGVRSQFSARAEVLTSDLINRAMANASVISDAASPYVFNDLGAGAPAAGDCQVNACTAVQVAAYDIWEISNRLGSELSLPNALITTTYSAATSEYSVALTWNANGVENYTASDCDVNNNLNSGCLYTVVRLL